MDGVFVHEYTRMSRFVVFSCFHPYLVLGSIYTGTSYVCVFVCTTKLEI
jgi:hypothetical protein